jgi:protein SCO1
MSNCRRLRVGRGVRCVCAGVACAVATFASAAIYPGGKAPPVGFEQRLGALLPLDAPFVDASGHPIHLGDYFRRDAAHPAVPVVLVLGYYRCRNLCETEMEGVVQALAATGLSRHDYRVLAVSIDPDETAQDAATRRRIDLEVADLASSLSSRAATKEPLLLDALVGSRASIDRLARQAGFVFTRDDVDRSVNGNENAQPNTIAHAAGFLVATPDGHVSRYFLGVRHDPADLRRAIDAAAGNEIGSAVDSLLLLCAHVDPTLGRFTADVMLGLRLLGIVLILILGISIWRHRNSHALRIRS